MRINPPTRKRSWAALICGWLLAAMAVGQLVSLPDFVDALRTYDVLGAAAPVAGVAIPLVELGGAIGLLAFRRTPAWVGRAGGACALAAAVIWSTLAAQAFARGLSVPNCGCFGRFLGQELRWWVLLEDVEFLLIAYWAAAGAGLGLPLPHRRRTTPSRTPEPSPAS